MQQNRRDFLKGAFWMGAAAVAAQGMADAVRVAGTGKMTTYHDKPIRNLRVGVVGLGRGQAGISGFTLVPGGYISAICDINAARRNRTLKYLADKKAPTPKVYGDKGPEDWKRMCEDPEVDLIYNSTPWQLHVPIALYAMEHGKHVVTEVPSAFTVEECWKLVETSERTQRHCMQLENCCYGETEMLAYNLVHLGLLGEISHGEGAYIHDLRASNYNKWDEAAGGGGYWDYWRLRHNAVHGGNQYPTHGLGPICMDMDINRGDRFDYRVSVDSKQFGFEEVGKGVHGDDPWRSGLKVKMADMNTSIIKTVLGRTIMVQHDVGTARPYSRLNLIQGSRGVLQDYPLRIAIEETLGKGAQEIEAGVTKAMEDYAPKSLNGLEKRLGLMVLIASVSPLIGMCGTVTGMINSFSVMAEAAGLDPGAVAGGISEALITTAAGLIIAIPGVVAYNMFQKRVEEWNLQLEGAITDFIESFA